MFSVSSLIFSKVRTFDNETGCEEFPQPTKLNIALRNTLWEISTVHRATSLVDISISIPQTKEPFCKVGCASLPSPDVLGSPHFTFPLYCCIADSDATLACPKDDTSPHSWHHNNHLSTSYHTLTVEYVLSCTHRSLRKHLLYIQINISLYINKIRVCYSFTGETELSVLAENQA